MALNTVPTKIVRPIVLTKGLNDVGGFAIATLTSMDSEMFDCH